MTLADIRANAMFSFFKHMKIEVDESKFPELVKLRDQVLVETTLKK